MRVPNTPEGSLLDQRCVGVDERSKGKFDKNYWRKIECYKCGEEGHPISYFNNKKDKPKKDSDKSIFPVRRKAMMPTVPVKRENKALSKKLKRISR